MNSTSISDMSSEPSVEVISEPPTPRQKAPRTPAQLQALDLARQKAMKIRSEKADLNRKEKEVARSKGDSERLERAARIEKEYDALQRAPAYEESEPPPTPKKPVRRVIHVREASDDEEIEEVEVRLPKAARQFSDYELRYQASVQKMFSYE